MQKFTKTNLSDIPFEEAHGGSGSRQMLLKPEHVISQHWEAVTKGFLKSGSVFDWHDHKDIDEMFIVLQGEGNFFCENERAPYQAGDVITVKANTMHKIAATGKETTEGFFIRIKVL